MLLRVWRESALGRGRGERSLDGSWRVGSRGSVELAAAKAEVLLWRWRRGATWSGRGTASSSYGADGTSGRSSSLWLSTGYTVLVGTWLDRRVPWHAVFAIGAVFII